MLLVRGRLCVTSTRSLDYGGDSGHDANTGIFNTRTLPLRVAGNLLITQDVVDEFL